MERKLWSSQADGFVSLVDMLAERAEAQPDQRAYTYLVDGIVERDTLTYRQLDRQSREIAVMLQSALDQGDRALLMYSPGLDFVSAFFGCLCAGVIAVPVYPPQSSRPERSLPGLRAIYSESGAKAILCTEEGFGKFASLLQGDPELSKCPLLATDHYGLEDIEEWKVPEVHSDSIAFLQYTSGSTAAPKGVVVSHGNIVHNLAYIQNISHHESDNVLVSWLPTYHDMGLFSGVLFPLFNDCPAYLMSPVSFLQKPFRWLQAISYFRGTNSGAPDFAFELCAQKSTAEQRSQLDLSSWKIAFNGAEPIRKSTLEGFSKTFRECGFRSSAIFPVYGLAESTVLVSGKPRSGEDTIGEDTDGKNTSVTEAAVAVDGSVPAESVSCGSPKFGMEVIIVDPKLAVEMESGQIGEIWVSGPSVAQGYWNLSRETEATFHAFLESGRGPFLRTGDLGFMRKGELFVTGRIKDLIIVRGRKHYPQDIEQTVEQSHSEVHSKSSAAVSVVAEDGPQLVILAEVNRRLRSGRSKSNMGQTSSFEGDCDEIMDVIRQAVSEQHELQTAAIVLLAPGSIPKTSSGKIRRHACCMAILAGTLDCIASWSLANFSCGSFPEPSRHSTDDRLSTTAADD